MVTVSGRKRYYVPVFENTKNSGSGESQSTFRRAKDYLREVIHVHNRPEFDVLVIGAGHAGCESTLAAARMGARVLMVTQNIDRIGWMSCNPAIGGLGKGHLVKEIDALGGEMGRAADKSGIQFRRLNTRKGPAVRASRCQSDKWRYADAMRRTMEHAPGVTIKQATVTGLVTEDTGTSKIIRGVDTDLGVRYLAKTVVVTTGTFMRGLCHYGEQ